ncbi:unnamed protein product [Phyllotreta striolata]|uniref:EGF-like domain-containing protein n=1 Tax=Phyllotreta striolata TaxID=444603 RepID=A0A9N9TJS0_PHYSR|nr:unnamed protein product [Phyllotreta striolata]
MPKVDQTLTQGGHSNTNTRRKRENRVVKKLVRVQLVADVETTTKKSPKRRRLKIKKKKRKLQTGAKIEDDYTDHHLEQPTRPRKRIVVTRKRLIHPNNTEIPITSTRVNPNDDYNTIINDYEDTSQENEIDLDEDVTESSPQELVTLKESDFYYQSDENPTTTEEITTTTELEQTTTDEITTTTELQHNTTDEITTTKELEQTTTEDITTTSQQNDDTPIISETTNSTTTEKARVTTSGDNNKAIFQEIPEYEPYFPELTESLDAPVILLKTTVITSIEHLTKTILNSRQRTYTFVVTRVAGDEQIVTSTTEVRPHTKTSVVTETVTKLTTLTLLDIDATNTLTNTKSSIIPVLEKPLSEDDRIRNADEARNLATRVMSNGVEVIVAGDKTAPGDKDFKRLLTAGTQRPVTLKASTLTDHVVMMVPQESTEIESFSSLYPNQFITKTCLTTFTYLTTFLEGGTTTVSSHEQVVSNIATEERNTGKILPTPAVGVVLTQYPNLSVGVFHTTYTYLNTILEGDQPLVVSSKHTVTNTVTAPDDYLALVKSSETLSPVKDTNTYYSTIGLEKTLYEGNKTSVTSTKEVVTQVVITESVPPRATSVMTSYIALDVNDNPDASYVTTDIVKTYFVTYTYHDTVTVDNQQVVHTNTSVSSDVITEKLYIIPKTTVNNFQIYTTKSYLTTFTYFTTLLQDDNKETPTIVNSRTSVVQNLVSETVDLSLLDKANLKQIKNAINKGAKSVVKTISLYNGETFEITAVADEMEITPTKVQPIEKTQMPDIVDSSASNIITGSTIVFVDDDPFAQLLTSTPVLKSTKINKPKRSTKTKTKPQSTAIKPSKTKTTKTTVKSSTQSQDLLGLGSINIKAIAPVLNAMAGLISTNLKANRKSDVNVSKSDTGVGIAEDVQSRSPIYIPVRGMDDDFEIAESQNIATFEWVDKQSNNKEINPHEMSIISNGIPISPGEIITTNSDVIVGKPGRILPRIPSIPLHQVTQENEIPIGMKPPPPPPQPKSNYDYKRIPVNGNSDYIGPPPRVPQKPFKSNEINGNYAKNYIPNHNRYNQQIHAHKHEDNVYAQNVKKPVYVQKPEPEVPEKYRPAVYPKIDEAKILTRIQNEPIVLPEIIERSTGQPLLVNIQPSQVAFVNIPFNRTTALIYGGSTEPHKNGQYFDDPSPYQHVDINKVAPKIYQPDLPNQKRVNGVIKVENQLIEHRDVSTDKAQAPNNLIVNMVPPSPPPMPLSYGMIHHGADFNAHVINHDEILPRNFTNKYYGTYKKNVVRPNVNIPEYMTPPTKRPYNWKTKRPIPISVPPQPFTTTPIDFKPSFPIYEVRYPAESDDLETEDGEVVQESNDRPLRPGEVPYEVYLATSTSTQRTVEHIRVQSNTESTTNKPTENYNSFAIGSHEVVPVNDVNNVKPVLIFIDEKQQSKDTFFNKQIKERPSVTSLPINSFKEKTSSERPSIGTTSKERVYTHVHFNNDRPAVTSLPINKRKEFNNRDRPAVTSVAINKDVLFGGKYGGTQTEKPFSGVPSKTISSNEIIRKDIALPKPTTTTSERPERPVDMNLNTGEVPVPVISDMEVMKPPTVESTAATPTTVKLPPKKNVIVKIPPTKPPSNEKKENVFGMVPPTIKVPSKKKEENVVGMLPPPNKQDNVIGMVPPPPASSTPNYSTEKSTTKLRTRRPYTRRSTTHKPSTTTPKKVITPSPSLKIKPSLEVIIGQKEEKFETSTVKSSSHQPPVTKPEPKIELSSSEVLLHHAGNEIKAVPEATKPLPNRIRTVFDESRSKIQIPTRYITHTKTATVTITKTTVVKSMGMTPSTLTILVTKTEMSTIVETVTEIHTLVKPTSIYETITTTVKQENSMHPNPVLHNTQYPPLVIRPAVYNYTEAFVDSSQVYDDEDFIIRETDPPIIESERNKNPDPLEDNDTILVVMTDKNTKNLVKVPEVYETQDRDEIVTTKENNILLGGVLIANHPENEVTDRCEPECKASRNELCQKIDGILRCICRPGFARMFPDRPCLPTYTYDLELTLDRIGRDRLHFYDDLKNPNSTEHYKFTQATGEAIDRMVMQSDLRDAYHGVKVYGFEPGAAGIISKSYLQLSENMEEKRLEDILKNYLSNNSLSLGGTDIYSSPLMDLKVKDFDECTRSHLHDCSENARCFNLKGTYSCSCKEGYADVSENMLYPGRICSAEMVGCERCNYHGTCYSRGSEEVLCECFQWYTGQFCHINLKVLLIALVTVGTLLFGLLLTCIILTCMKGKPRSSGVAGGINFLPQGNGGRSALDRRAMIQDTSSEDDNKSETSRYVKKPKNPPKKTSKVSLQVSDRNDALPTVSYEDQKDRSLTVMIPRAKYHPAPPTSPLSNYTSFDVRKPSMPIVSNETKLLSLLDAGPSPSKSEAPRKFSNARSESIPDKSSSRKTSGALISAGFEVSATVGHTGTLGTTCGTEADRSENATLIQKISADLLSSTGTRSQFNTLRKSLGDDDLGSDINASDSNWLDMLPRVMTVSEARSCDETTIPPPMKSLRADFDSKHSSHHNDEANTMAERDLGSTFLLPHTHLYKPDRGSDISGFESL